MNINVIQGNAIDLSMYDDNTFDITLVLGPLYHLFKKEEYKMYTDYHLSICEREDLIGYSGYILSIIEK